MHYNLQNVTFLLHTREFYSFQYLCCCLQVSTVEEIFCLPSVFQLWIKFTIHCSTDLQHIHGNLIQESKFQIKELGVYCIGLKLRVSKGYNIILYRKWYGVISFYNRFLVKHCSPTVQYKNITLNP